MAFCPAGQLEKYGWETGSGLGREQQGIKEAIKVKLKFDTTGVGHDPGEQFTHQWWDVAFNTAAKNIQVTESEDGVEIKKNGECHISTKKNAKLINKPGMLYGSFIKAATLTDGNELVEDTSDSTNDSDDDDKMAKLHSVLSDEELFKACGGRTAHKGARHGLKLNGKLARIAQQESSLNNSPAYSEADSFQNVSKKRKKKHRKQRTEASEDLNGEGKNEKQKKKTELYEDCNINENCFKKSKKKNKKSKSEVKESVDILSNSGVKDKKKPKLKKRKKDTHSSVTESETIENDISEPRKKKKKKHKQL